MKNNQKSTPRHLKKKAELFAEMEVENIIVQRLEETLSPSVLQGPPSGHRRLEKARQVEDFCRTLTVKQRERLTKEMEILAPLSESSALSIADSVLPWATAMTRVEVVPYMREGLKEGVGQKGDLLVRGHTPRGDSEQHMFSLKQYRTKSNLQLGSGTFLSTLLGLAYDVTGRGRYVSHDGERFFGSKGDCAEARAQVLRDYGAPAANIVDSLIRISNSVKDLRQHEIYPGHGWWKQQCAQLTQSAVPLFQNFLQIVFAADAPKFTGRLLHRAGLGCEHETVVTFGAAKGLPTTLNTLSDASFGKAMKIGKLATADLRIAITRSGQDATGGGIAVRVYERSSGSLLIELTIPLTINRNGAWQLCQEEGRYCAKDGGVIAYGHLRPEKSKEMATSTNLWLRVADWSE